MALLLGCRGGEHTHVECGVTITQHTKRHRDEASGEAAELHKYPEHGTASKQSEKLLFLKYTDFILFARV